jgi:hypothetical protein
MNVVEATADFEGWFGQFCSLHAPDLEYKHARMADQADPYPFFRGTYYRWVTLWPETCSSEASAPRVLAVGDLHLANYGTWRDLDGRLCWGVNDFDEVDELPYTNDLVRLAASVRAAIKGGNLAIKYSRACRAILTGYRDVIEAGGVPFVLEEQHPELRAMAMMKERDPVRYWAKLTAVLADPPADPPPSALTALAQGLPDPKLPTEVRFRPFVGIGSLGKPRYVALAKWAGAWVAREAKSVIPPATMWAAGATPGPIRMAEASSRAVRCPDPFYKPGPEWVARRLAPRSSRIDLGQLASVEDVLRVLWAMGGEAANIHLGAPQAADAIRRDLSARPTGWLVAAGRSTSKSVFRDWREWRAAYSGTATSGSKSSSTTANSRRGTASGSG